MNKNKHSLLQNSTIDIYCIHHREAEQKRNRKSLQSGRHVCRKLAPMQQSFMLHQASASGEKNWSQCVFTATHWQRDQWWWSWWSLKITSSNFRVFLRLRISLDRILFVYVNQDTIFVGEQPNRLWFQFWGNLRLQRGGRIHEFCETVWVFRDSWTCQKSAINLPIFTVLCVRASHFNPDAAMLPSVLVLYL